MWCSFWCWPIAQSIRNCAPTPAISPCCNVPRPAVNSATFGSRPVISGINTSIRRARAGGTEHLRIAAWAMDVPKYGPGPGPDEYGGSTADFIVAHLETESPASVAQLAAALGLSNDAVQSSIRRLRKKPRRGRLIITGWALIRGRGGREGPIYGIGTASDAPRPDFSHAQREAEKRYTTKRRVSSVMAGGTMRKPATTRGHAGFFDGLAR